jgi:hypothetical protein
VSEEREGEEEEVESEAERTQASPPVQERGLETGAEGVPVEEEEEEEEEAGSPGQASSPARTQASPAPMVDLDSGPIAAPLTSRLDMSLQGIIREESDFV